jgi:CarD family transcriptional regulator
MARKGEVMRFSVGDKVVHPRRGPGRIVDVERQEFLQEAKQYYVIDMPARALTVRIPVLRVAEVGLRPAMTRKKLARVLDILHARPRRLPADHKERQESVREKIHTARPIKMAEAVRDLTWRGRSAHLTKTDSELLKLVQDFLAAEMALASDIEVSEANETIELALTGSMDAMMERQRRERERTSLA